MTPQEEAAWATRLPVSAWFGASLDGQKQRQSGQPFGAGLLSDGPCGSLGFTGTFVALTCLDLSGRRLPAGFCWAGSVESV